MTQSRSIASTEIEASAEELTLLAKMVTGSSNNVEKIASVIKAPLLPRLDYHGISALVNEKYLDQSTQHELSQRKPLLAANEALRFKELNSLFNAFSENGLTDYVVFKGTALAYSEYSQPWQRPRTDTDLLISRDQINLFTDVFTQLGYERLFAISGKYISYQATFGKRLVGNATINIDVHWRINNRQCLANTYSLTQLHQSGQALSAFAAAPISPCQVDSLLIACLHRLGHHHKEERLAWLYDIHLLASQLDTEQWSDVINKAIDKKISALCLNGLKTCKQYFASHIPEHVIEELNTAARKSESSQIFLNRKATDWALTVNDVRSIKGILGKLHFIAENIFPPASYIRERMGTDSVFHGYVLRALRGLKRLFTRA